VPEPSHHQPRQEHPRAFAIRIHDVRTGPPYEGELGEGVLLRTDRGDLQAIWHQAPEAQHGVIWVSGARGASAGRVRAPMPGSRTCCGGTISPPSGCATGTPTSCPNVRWISWPGFAYLQQDRVQRVVLVGHSFGGAVVITAGAVHDRVAGVVALASQTYGARLAGQLAPRPLLVVHGKADTRLPYTCGVQIYAWAQEPKQLVLYEGAEHRLDECAEDLDQLLTQWIPATLRASVSP